MELAARFLTADIEQRPEQRSGPTFGRPFKFGAPLNLQTRQPAPDYLTDQHCLSTRPWMDPASMWFPSGQPEPSRPAKVQLIKASVVAHRGRASQGDQEQQPPAPATVTISRVQASGEMYLSGVTLRQAATGVAMRENGTVPPGGYMVHERLDRREAKKRVAAAVASGLLPQATRGGKVRRRWGEGPVAVPSGNLSALQRVVAAWAEEEAEAAGPGPGQYITAGMQTGKGASMSGPAFTMGARTKARVAGMSMVAPDALQMPGPGQYDPGGLNNCWSASGPAFSLTSRPKAAVADAVPGPGQYEAEPPSIGLGPAFTMRTKPRDKVEDLPGPGEYDLDRDTRTGPAVTICGRPHAPSPEDAPGPADYQRLSRAGQHAPAFSLLGRIETKPAGADLPAPGEYELPVSWRTGPIVTMASRPAAKAISEPSPGPGEYHVLHASVDGPCYTIAGRLPAPEPSDDPGPGDYHIHLRSSAPAYTLGSRPQGLTTVEVEAALLPGPGQYDTFSRAMPGSPTAPAYTMAARPVSPLPREEEPPVPGPGYYNVLETDLWTKGPSYSMTGREGLAEPGPDPDSPGPGQYSVAAALEAGPAFTMGARPAPRTADIHSGPAPGDYELRSSVGATGPAFSVPHAGVGPASPRPSSPGPGEYHLPSPSSHGPAFTMAASVRAEPKASDSPGPTDYSPHASVRDMGPAFTMAGRAPEPLPQEPQPGPGEYDTRPREPGGPSFTMSAKPAPSQPGARGVGPGTYDTEHPGLHTAPAYTIAAKPRESGTELSPGPGSYDDPPSPRGPAYTMAAKAVSLSKDTNDLGHDSPGPTAYVVPLDSPKGPAYTMRAKPVDSGVQAEGPGPGEYESSTTERGPAFSLRGRTNDPSPPASPGPGAYHLSRNLGGPAFSMAGRSQELTVLGDDVAIDLDIPGPGMYGAPGQDLIGSSGPAWTLGGRHKGAVWDGEPHQGGPGPGEYGEPVSPRGPAYSLGSRLPSRQAARGQDSPGPGLYGATVPPGGAPAFTLGARLAPPRPTGADAPAPGDYGSPGDVGPHGLAFSLGAKRSEPNPAMHVQGPGPGEHQAVLHPSTGPAFSLGRRLKDLLGLKKEQVLPRLRGPEPGQYFQEMGPSGPAFTFASRAGLPEPGHSLAAPGDYEDPRALNTGPAWSLRGRPDAPKPKMAPGPGQYDHTQRPQLSSILRSRPQGHLQQVVQAFSYANPHGTLPGPARRVSFSGGTQFRDSTEFTLHLGQENVAGLVARAGSPPSSGAPQQTTGPKRIPNRRRAVSAPRARTRLQGGAPVEPLRTVAADIRQQRLQQAGAGGPPQPQLHYNSQPAGPRYVYRPAHGSVEDAVWREHHDRAAGGTHPPSAVSAVRPVGGGGHIARPTPRPSPANFHGAARAPPGEGQRAPAPGVQLAQPAATYTTEGRQRLVRGTPPLVLAELSRAAGKPAMGVVRRTPRQLVAPVALVSRTEVAQQNPAALRPPLPLPPSRNNPQPKSVPLAPLPAQQPLAPNSGAIPHPAAAMLADMAHRQSRSAQPKSRQSPPQQRPAAEDVTPSPYQIHLQQQYTALLQPQQQQQPVAAQALQQPQYAPQQQQQMAQPQPLSQQRLPQPQQQQPQLQQPTQQPQQQQPQQPTRQQYTNAQQTQQHPEASQHAGRSESAASPAAPAPAAAFEFVLPAAPPMARTAQLIAGGDRSAGRPVQSMPSQNVNVFEFPTLS